MKNRLIISVKPEFSKKIFDRSKTIELRKSEPKSLNGDFLIVYTTHPKREVSGICRVKDVIKLPPAELWSKYSELLGIDEERFFEYYKDSQVAIGIVLGPVRKFKKAISLSKIRADYPFFRPPQTYSYLERESWK